MSSEFVNNEQDEEETDEPEFIKVNMDIDEAEKKFNKRPWLPLKLSWQNNSAGTIDTEVQILYGKAISVRGECEGDDDWESCYHYYYPLTVPVILKYTRTFDYDITNDLWIFNGKKWVQIVLHDSD